MVLIPTLKPAVTQVNPPRTVRNDRAVLAAALRTLVDEGWSALTPRHVSEVAGVSRTAVLARHADRSAIGAALWRTVVADELLINWNSLIAVVDAASGSAEELQAAMEPFLHPDDAMRAAGELLLVSRYDRRVHDAISETVGDALNTWTTPVSGRVTRALAAQRAFVLGLAHGYLTEAMRHHTIDIDLSAELTLLSTALANPTRPARMPSKIAAYLDEPVDFGTGDPMVETVLRSTLQLVGEAGFDAATIEAITEASGFTRSVIFNRYASKRDLFVDATNRALSGIVELNDGYQMAIAADHGSAIAEACLLREAMRPGRDVMRTITFEQIRLSWHDVDLLTAIDAAILEHQHALASASTRPDAEIRGHLVTEVALGHGIVTLTGIQPLIWELPIDVVLVPFRS